METTAHPITKPTCRALFVAMFWIGLKGFGGVLPHMRHALVIEKAWLSDAEFVALLGMGQILPGPNICNLAVIFGTRLHGWRGALACLGGLLCAPVIIVLSMGKLYGALSDDSLWQGTLHGLGIAAAAMVLGIACKMSRSLPARAWAVAVSVATCAAMVAGWPLLAVLGVALPLSLVSSYWSQICSK